MPVLVRGHNVDDQHASTRSGKERSRRAVWRISALGSMRGPKCKKWSNIEEREGCSLDQTSPGTGGIVRDWVVREGKERTRKDLP